MAIFFIPCLVPSCAVAGADGARTTPAKPHKGGTTEERGMLAQGVSTRPRHKTSAQEEVPSCASLCHLVPSCASLCDLVLACAILCHLVRPCAVLCHLVPSWAILCQLVPSCATLCQFLVLWSIVRHLDCWRDFLGFWPCAGPCAARRCGRWLQDVAGAASGSRTRTSSCALLCHLVRSCAILCALVPPCARLCQLVPLIDAHSGIKSTASMRSQLAARSNFKDGERSLSQTWILTPKEWPRLT